MSKTSSQHPSLPRDVDRHRPWEVRLPWGDAHPPLQWEKLLLTCDLILFQVDGL